MKNGEEYNLLPPHDLEVEKAVLGALVLERYTIIENPVMSDWFYDTKHQKIIAALLELKKRNIPIDLLQVTTYLKNNKILDEIGGPGYITQLTRHVASAAHIKHHIRIIQELYLRRTIANDMLVTYRNSFDLSVDIEEVVNVIQANTLDLLDFKEDAVLDFEGALDIVNNRIKLNKAGEELSGIGSGITKLDKFSSGMQPGDLIIVAGETSQGKTSLGITMVKNSVMDYNAKAAIYSLEMGSFQLVSRIISQETDIPAKKILYEGLSDYEERRVAEFNLKVQNLPIYFDEKSTTTIDQICSSIRRLKVKYGINIVLVDYIQLISGDHRKTEEGQLGDIARKLKNIAKEQGVVVIALSQLSRDKQRPFPTISRLRGSGQIEEAADIVMLLYRPEAYNVEKFKEPFEDEPVENMAQVVIGKGRNTGTGTFLLRFNNETTQFLNY